MVTGKSIYKDPMMKNTKGSEECEEKKLVRSVSASSDRVVRRISGNEFSDLCRRYEC